MKEYRVCHKEHGSEHTTAVKFRDWGGRQNWQGNATDEEREQAALEWFDEHRRYNRIFYGIKECDMWLESREVSAWKEVFADGGMAPENMDVAGWTHHHEPTVEDVLREFAYGLGVPVADSYVAATAAKLRLAGDE